MRESITEYAHFFTATNLEWKPLLLPDKYKDIIIESMRFLVNDQRVIIYAFVLIPNHIYIIWQLRAGKKREDVQRDFLKHTAQAIKENMKKNNREGLQPFLVNAKDSKYQFWERAPSVWWSDWKAIFSLLILEIWVLLSGMVYYKVFMKKDLVPDNRLATVSFAVVVVLSLIKYFVFVHRDHWKEYVQEFGKWPERKNKLGALIA
ncbi:MAG: hypothetical protein E6H07_16785 [Bacteroidetes bacterium]|nr:MAG: hypothetical protein E6H07_16785 [Bacteroidota bacterium]